MPYRLHRFIGACAVFLGLAAGACATPVASEPRPVADAPALSRHPQWRRLLHAGADGRSEILSPDFFLSPDGARDPQAELHATLEAMRDPMGASADAHARCRFPARALWLARQGALPAEPAPHAVCPRLAQWARIDRLRSVSVLLVSGYFGNPASTFGHSLLRLNTEDGRASDGLVDLGVNFGALVPEGESTPVYVLKGLTGGYEAGFSDKAYHAHDLMYSRTEFRDMWEHELALEDDERLMLVYHLWEIAGRKFTYYFLKQNCAYRMAELLALVREDDALLARSAAWFAPVEMFHRLQDAERTGGRPWFRAVRFVPSAERALRHQLAALDADQRRAVDAAIAGDGFVPAGALQELDPARRPGVLDALMAYYDYRLAAEAPDGTPATRQAKDVAVRARLQLPPAAPAPLGIADRPSPAAGSAPMLFALGLGHDGRDGDFVRVQAAPFSYGRGGHHGLADGELVVLDTVVDIARGGAAQLERIDLVRVSKMQAEATRIPGESALSWQVRLGARRERIDGERRLRAGARGGVGLAARRSGVTAFAMVDAVALGNPASLGVEPHVGLLLQREPWAMLLVAGARHESATRRWTPRHHAQASRRLSPRTALRVEFTHDGTARSVLSLVGHW